MPDLDRARAQRLMTQAGLDALILFSPEAFRHATGAGPGVATMWRREGAVAVLIPADAALPETAVISDLFAPAFRSVSPIADLRETPIWVEALTMEHPESNAPARAQFAPLWQGKDRPAGNRRPETFDALNCYRHLRDALTEKGLMRGRIGVELEAVSARGFPALVEALAPATLIDATDVAQGLRAVKSATEIAHLRAAVGLAEQGIAAVRAAITPGVTQSGLSAIWRETIARLGPGSGLTGAWDYISVGPDPWGGDATALRGDLVKVDVGCLVAGYTSDSGRTFVLGPPSRLQSGVWDALRAGFEAGLPLLTPGTPLAEVHRVTEAAIRARGLDGYTRGHFGHSLGTGPGSEEWPFISASATALVEAGMVLAFECPFYIKGLGGMILEDQIEITESGPVPMNRFPRDLGVCG